MNANPPQPNENWRDALGKSWRGDAPQEADLSRLWAGIERRAEVIDAERRVAAARAVPSPWIARHVGAATTFAAVMLLISGGGMSAAAEGSLPGDFLYPVKVSVNEAAIELFATTPEADARAKVQIVHRRTDEIAALSEENRLSAEVAADIAESIGEHAAEIVTEVADESADGEDGEDGRERAAEIVSTELAAAIDESADALEDALLAAGVEPEPEVALFSLSMSAKIAPDEGAPEGADLADDARLAPEDAAEDDNAISDEDVAQIQEARASLDALASSLDLLDGEAEIGIEPEIELPVFEEVPPVTEEPPATSTPEQI